MGVYRIIGKTQTHRESQVHSVPHDYPRASITFTFKAMGSRERPPPAALPLPERGISVLDFELQTLTDRCRAA